MKRSQRERGATALKRLGLVITFACISMTANADQNVGKITASHLNGAADPQRGMCVQMNPPLPGVWACLWRSNPLYKETTALLLTALAGARTCTVTFGPGPDGN